MVTLLFYLRLLCKWFRSFAVCFRLKWGSLGGLIDCRIKIRFFYWIGLEEIRPGNVVLFSSNLLRLISCILSVSLADSALWLVYILITLVILL